MLEAVHTANYRPGVRARGARGGARLRLLSQSAKLSAINRSLRATSAVDCLLTKSGHKTLGQCTRRGVGAKHLREGRLFCGDAAGKCFALTGLCQSRVV